MVVALKKIEEKYIFILLDISKAYENKQNLSETWW